MHERVDIPAHAGQHGIARVEAAQAQASDLTALHTPLPRHRLLIRRLAVVVVPVCVVARARAHPAARHVDHRRALQSRLLFAWGELGNRPAAAFRGERGG